MNVIVRFIHRGIEVACLVEEKPKTYRVVKIPQVKWQNMLYGSRIAKADNIIVTKFSKQLLKQINAINKLSDKCEKEIQKIDSDYQAKCIEIFNQIIQSSNHQENK
jgi:hypothetical protein